jgi:hypothetical protein
VMVSYLVSSWSPWWAWEGCGKAQRICQMEIQSPLARRIPPQRLQTNKNVSATAGHWAHFRCASR